MQPGQMADEIKKKLDEEEAKPRKEDDQADPNVNRASNAGWCYDCERYLVLSRTAPDKKIIDPNSARRMKEGEKQEILMRETFIKAGVLVLPYNSPEDRALFLRQVIHGPEIKFEVDDLIDLGPDKKLIPIDYKSCSSTIFREVSRYRFGDELKRSRLSWIRHYPAQMTVYCAGWEAPFGIMPFKDKESGQMHIIECPFNAEDYKFIEGVFIRVNGFIEKGVAPAPINKPEICGTCGFEGYCYENAEKPSAEITKVADEEKARELLALLTERQGLLDWGAKAAASKLEKIEDSIKDMTRELGAIVAIGDFRVTNAKTIKTVYDVPDDVKAKYKKAQDIWKPIKIEYFGGTI